MWSPQDPSSLELVPSGSLKHWSGVLRPKSTKYRNPMRHSVTWLPGTGMTLSHGNQKRVNKVDTVRFYIILVYVV